MIFKQIFDSHTSTYTYLLADAATREAVIIDPVLERVDRDVALISELGLKLLYTIDTHAHADHITAADQLRKRLNAQSVVSSSAGVQCVDVAVEHGDRIEFGSHSLEVRHTPGHTKGCATFVLDTDGETKAFTGDTLLVRGCGRTDFQEGSADDLYRSVHEQIFSLPDETRIYPGHDYKGHSSTTVAEEKAHNPRLNTGVGPAEFAQIMAELDLPPPRLIDVAVPANLRGGRPLPNTEPNTDPNTDPTKRAFHDALPEELHDLSDYRIVDVRRYDEYAGKLGHLEHAQLTPLNGLRTAMALCDREEPLLVVCRTGHRSVAACEWLSEMGFMNVTNLAGGMLAWNADGGRLIVEQPPSTIRMQHAQSGA